MSPFYECKYCKYKNTESKKYVSSKQFLVFTDKNIQNIIKRFIYYFELSVHYNVTKYMS